MAWAIYDSKAAAMLRDSNMAKPNRDFLHTPMVDRVRESFVACGTMHETVPVVVRINLPSFFNNSQMTVNFYS